MALGRASGIALVGLRGHVVNVEAHMSAGLPGFTLIGLPDTSLSEARDRVRAAITSCGIEFPARKIGLARHRRGARRPARPHQ